MSKNACCISSKSCLKFKEEYYSKQKLGFRRFHNIIIIICSSRSILSYFSDPENYNFYLIFIDKLTV